MQEEQLKQKTRTWRPASPKTKKLDLGLILATDFLQSFF
jgi:hypothetical protein